MSNKRTVIIYAIILIVALVMLWVCNGFGKDINITITKRESNYIEGMVVGLENPEKYKVVVYSKLIIGLTWTKQPRPGNLKGFSWAEIQEDGTWALGLVVRFSQKMKFIDKYVAVVLPRSQIAPDTTTDLKKLKPIAISN